MIYEVQYLKKFNVNILFKEFFIYLKKFTVNTLHEQKKIR